MDLEQVSRWRDLAGQGRDPVRDRLLGLVDGLLAQFREPPNLVKVLPGTSMEIDGD